MGINTIAVLLNDCVHEMENRGDEIGRMMARAVKSWRFSTGDGADFRVGRVISSSHADHHQIVVVHGNMGCEIHLAKDLPDLALGMMADCLKRHGWSAAPPAKEKKIKKARP